jgi:hypothetical protein
MVKRLLIATLLILPCALSLTTCDFVVTVFSMSPFPSYLAQAVDAVDMREDIERFLGDNYNDWDSDVHVLRNSTREQVFLVVRRHPGPQMVYVFDTSLDLQAYFRSDAQRNIALVEAPNPNENFVVGGGQFDGSDLSILNPPPAPSYPQISEDAWQKFTFSDGTSNYIVWNDGNYLGCTKYTSGWGSSTPGSSPPIKMDGDVRLAGLGYEPSGDPVLLGAPAVYLLIFYRDWDSDRGSLYIVRTDATKYPNPPYTIDLVSDGLSDGRTSSRVNDVEDRRHFLYTRKGVVVEARNRGTFRLVSLEGEEIKSFFITSDERTPFDFDIDGEYYYVFNQNTFTLYKAKTGF